jgi:ubiquinone/menaquinone biosynthesis C-methylase UbiE
MAITVLKKIIHKVLPKSIVNILKSISHKGHSALSAQGGQDLSVYWDEEMAKILESWGEKSVWKEIKLLMVNCEGKVLDIACGPGKTIEVLHELPLEVHGCDISDLLIQKAIERGINPSFLKVCDATNMPYENDAYNYAYSIGSLEHFTEEGILKFLNESYRITSRASYHMIPTSRSNQNEGWMKTYQSFHNNSVEWWREKFESVYKNVIVLDSTWDDNISVGKWFVCIK